MSVIAGTVRNGVVVPNRSLEVADGTPAEIHLGEREHLGMREEDWPDTPEGRAELDGEWAALEAVILTEEELAANEAWRQVMKKFNIDAVREQMGLPE